MSGSESGSGDRTEAATPRRLDQAREEGKLPVSRDLATLASLGGAALGAVMFGPAVAHRMADQSASLLGLLNQIRVVDGTVLGGPVSGLVFSATMLVGAVALPAGVCGAACTLLQTQFYIGGAPIRFQPSRISPAAGLARLFSQRHFLDFLKSCARLAILSALVWPAVGRSSASTIGILNGDLSRLLPTATEQIKTFARPLMIALACFAALDV
ncbi:MAG TPA: EscU/YscU/HrcU family type III secretion system export apparatus switch protein, partial [Rhodopila sp.]